MCNKFILWRKKDYPSFSSLSLSFSCCFPSFGDKFKYSFRENNFTNSVSFANGVFQIVFMPSIFIMKFFIRFFSITSVILCHFFQFLHQFRSSLSRSHLLLLLLPSKVNSLYFIFEDSPSWFCFHSAAHSSVFIFVFYFQSQRKLAEKKIIIIEQTHSNHCIRNCCPVCVFFFGSKLMYEHCKISGNCPAKARKTEQTGKSIGNRTKKKQIKPVII